MKFNIPDIGYRLKLTEDYTAHLLNAGVNTTILLETPSAKKAIEENRPKVSYYQSSGDGRQEWRDYESTKYPIFLPKDTVLSVARVYIRKGASDYSSVTFNILECPNKKYALKKKGGTWDRGIRNFFLHLDQLDTLEFEPVE